MKQLVKETGGLMILADSFAHDTFVFSLQKMFAKDEHDKLQMGLAGQIEVLVRSSKNWYMYEITIDPRELLLSCLVVCRCHAT